MLQENDIRQVVEQVLAEMTSNTGVEKTEGKIEIKSAKPQPESNVGGGWVVQQQMPSDGTIDDITKIDLKKQLLVPNPLDAKGYLKMKERTPARLGIWRAGPRYKTETILRFRADHAAAQDAVFSNVDEQFLKDMNLFTVQTLCKDKDEYLTRPDLGRKISDEGLQKIKENCQKQPQVQIFVSDGLSSAAVEANARDILPAIIQGLEGYKIQVGTPFFVKLGRVGAMDQISEIVGADVTCVLIGERPGLVTAESMSAYIAYKATINMPEARRTVISNIHKGGTPSVEAGAHIAELIKTMLEKKASGIDLKL
ncbi:Ethanolamine ammonia-lyase light chain [Brevibacillus laterosporus]|nr:ethanolamine ammonia-lyase subunit EutC [Brevibacillus laterosporus]RAP31204.1 Ethanolamine ammonia-lyase light chain [Brevibacillus laterosporus]